MATFVLVHGSWHGGWCWRKVRPLLRAAGHEVFTPTLTGLGERSHLANREIGLETHVQDVLNVLFYEDLSDVVLVGHSYGAQVVAAVADQAPERLRHLVNFDGSLPRSGYGLLDLLPPDRRLMWEERCQQLDGWRMPIPPVAEWGVTDPEDVAWMEPRLVPHPIKAPRDVLQLNGPLFSPRTYLYCTEKPQGGYAAGTGERARSEGWLYRELPTGHDAMVTMPTELAEILISVV